MVLVGFTLLALAALVAGDYKIAAASLALGIANTLLLV